MPHKHILLLTASVTPHTTNSLVVTDGQQRLEQYLSAFNAWSQTASDLSLLLLLVENSGASLREFDSIARSQGVTAVCLNAPQPTNVIARGKGAAEAEMLDFAAAWIKGEASGALLTKCTGRLYVPNLHKVVTAQDCLQAGIRSDFSYVDSRLFSIPSNAFSQYLTRMSSEIDEAQEVYMEHVLNRRLLRAISEGTPFKRWGTLPKFVGVSGSMGRNYASPRSKLYRNIHQAQRWLAHRRDYVL